MATVPNRSHGGSPANLRGRNAHAHVYGRGVNGHPFYSKQAWLASQAHQQGRLNGTIGPGYPDPLGGGPTPGGPHGTPPPPHKPGAGNPPPFSGGPVPLGPGQTPAGYQGLAGVLAALGKGVSAQQLANMQAGYTGANGHAIGGEHGAFGGLSDYAVNWLANSGLLTANQTQTVPTTDAQGNPLTGTPLLLANIQNQLYSTAPKTYSLASGVDASTLGNLLSQIGHSAYAPGYGAAGKLPLVSH